MCGITLERFSGTILKSGHLDYYLHTLNPLWTPAVTGNDSDHHLGQLMTGS